MLNLINILTLTTALTTQYNSTDINITISKNEQNNLIVNTKSDLTTEGHSYAYMLFLYYDTNQIKGTLINEFTGNQTTFTTLDKEFTNIAIGYTSTMDCAIATYKDYNQNETKENYVIYTNTIKEYQGEIKYTFAINTEIRRSNMEELLTALTTAIQSAVSIFVEGFGGLTQIFYNGTEITFIGGILVVGLAVMFLMMFLRWIVSFVKGI